MEWTKEQKQVIELRNRDILVSAAAGSGKTAVLVERIIQRITDEEQPIDVDRLLVVTFTNAAASEMRERIGDAIERALEEQPSNLHLQRQQSLIHNAQITTIDSFCLYVVRNYFHTIDLEPGFRIADEGELELLQEDVLDEVLEEWYAAQEEDFFRFMEAYTTAKSDQSVRSMIRNLYQNAQSNPWAEEWLSRLDEDYRRGAEELEEMPWMKKALEYYDSNMEGLLQELQRAWELTQDYDGPGMYGAAIGSDLELVQNLRKQKDYESIQKALSEIKGYAKLSAARNYEGSVEKQTQVKTIRERMKDVIAECREKLFFQTKEELQESLRRQQPMVHVLVQLVKSFGDAYALKKRKKNIVDFSDIEHFALEILVDRETKEPTGVAREFRHFFEEVMIDEYQDSNYLQEAILTAVSREAENHPNLFMVGDVKQSIYRFRLARPELFMDKYENYTREDSHHQKIELHQNFRSRVEVLDTVNDIFYKIMDSDLGRIHYDEDAALYPGAAYVELAQTKTPEVIEQDISKSPRSLSSTEVLLLETEEDRNLLEAKAIGKRIQQLHGSYQVTDKKSGALQGAAYSDMVILLRSPGSDAEMMAAELVRMGIPAHAVSRTGYFSTQEIQVLLNYLAVLDNPRQDIPLASVLTSWFGRLTEEELAQIRVIDREKHFYENVGLLMQYLQEPADTESAEKESDEESVDVESAEKESSGEESDIRRKEAIRAWETLEEKTQKKMKGFIRSYLKLREKTSYLSIHELLYEIFEQTGYLNYVTALPAGAQRRANVQMLMEKAIAFENTSYRGLFHFIRYIEKLRKYDVDFGEAEIVSENEEAVRIMSIHKSKGLEFPICFVAGLGKQFNKSDSRGKIIIHPELGIGLEDCDGERRIKQTTFVKQVLAKQVDLENLGEELRVLYVALTRAKEKLILVGGIKKAAQKLDIWRSDAFMGVASKGALSYGCRTKASCYLDWILPALFSYGEKYEIAIEDTKAAGEDLIQEIKSGLYKEELLDRIEQVDQKVLMQMEERLSFVYPRQEEVSLKTKVSVSELKHQAMVFEPEEAESVKWFEQEQPKPYVPLFIQEREENRGALRGTAVHRVMECMDFSLMEERFAGAGIQRTVEEIQPFIEKRLLELLEAHKIDTEMYELIQPKKIACFFTKEIAVRMSRAQKEGNLFLEKPFVMGKEAREIYSEMESSERVLIQGIVDVFFIEKGKIHVLDYKTDRVSRPKQLIDRYETQIELYAEALAKVFEVEIGEKLIYSFALGETIVL